MIVTVPANRSVPVYATGQPQTLTLRNTGTATVYAVSTNNPDINSGLPLNVGSSVLWDSGKPLYLIGGPVGGSVLVYDNGGVMFDADAVAQQILTSGLATDIASEINFVGIPSIDSPNIVFGSGRDFNAYASGVFDCSRYQSATIRVSSNAGNLPTPRTIDVYLNNPSQPAYQFVVPGNSAYTTFTFPVDGSAVYFAVNLLGSAFNATIELVLSYRDVVAPIYRCARTSYASLLVSGGIVVPALANGTVVSTLDFFSWWAITPPNTGATVYPLEVSKNGRAHFTAQHNGAAGTFSVGVIDTLSTAWVLPTHTLAVGNDLSFDFNIGYRPVSLTFQCTGMVGSAQFSIVTN